MKLLEKLDYSIKEFCKDYGYDPMTEKEFIKEFELDGKISIGKSEDWLAGYVGNNNSFCFHFGPSVDDSYVSDIISTSSYLKELVNEFDKNDFIDFRFYADVAENYHQFSGITRKEADQLYERLYDRVSRDFEVSNGEY